MIKAKHVYELPIGQSIDLTGINLKDGVEFKLTKGVKADDVGLTLINSTDSITTLNLNANDPVSATGSNIWINPK